MEAQGMRTKTSMKEIRFFTRRNIFHFLEEISALFLISIFCCEEFFNFILDARRRAISLPQRSGGQSGRSPLSSLLHGRTIVDNPTIYLGIQVTAGLRRNNEGKQAEFSTGPPNAGLLIHNGPPTKNLTQINNISHSLFVFGLGPVYRTPLAGVNWYAVVVWARVRSPRGHRPAANGRGEAGHEMATFIQSSVIILHHAASLLAARRPFVPLISIAPAF